MTIRRVPGDFRVREVLRGPARSDGAGAFAVYEVTKESLTTPEVVAKAARALGVRGGECSYAGLKDKHAVTVQHVAVRAGGKELPARLEEERWRAARVGWRDAALSARDIESNEFEIVVRDLTPEACAAMDARAERLRAGGPLWVVNYFGDQRFGSARHGEGFAARCLARGEFERALRLLIGTPHRKDSGVQRAFTRGLAAGWGEWGRLAAELPRCAQRKSVEVLAERARKGAVRENDFRDAFAALPYALQELCVDAWQSWLWNAVVREGVRAQAAGGLVAADDFGEMLFPVGADAERLRGVRVALASPAAVYEGAWAGVAERVMRAEGVALSELRVPGLRRPAFAEAERAVMVEAAGFAMGGAEADELAPVRGKQAPARFKRVVTFSLESGAYATVVLRAIGE